MTGEYSFPVRRFYDLLLDGTRRGFQLLRDRHPDERIYRYVLVLSAACDTIQPGINTEEALQHSIDAIARALAARKIAATPEDVGTALRYDLPGQDYRASEQVDQMLAAANRLLAEFGQRYMESLEDDAAITVDEDGIATVETRYDDLLGEIREVPREVLRALDREGLFGTGEARDRVVLDLCWFEGGISDASLHATGLQRAPQSLLNPPAIQERYEKALAEGAAISNILFRPSSSKD